MPKPKPATQYAALPLLRRDNCTEVVLVTSRDTGRWIIPKGWPMKKLKPWQAAAREAFEEAGIRGRIGKTPIGSYRYNKILDEGRSVPCVVRVYALEVEETLEQWPEAGERVRAWVSPEEAVKRVQEKKLKRILRGLA